MRTIYKKNSIVIQTDNEIEQVYVEEGLRMKRFSGVVLKLMKVEEQGSCGDLHYTLEPVNETHQEYLKQIDVLKKELEAMRQVHHQLGYDCKVVVQESVKLKYEIKELKKKLRKKSRNERPARKVA